MVLSVNSESALNSVNQLIFLMVKCGVLFEVRTEFLYVYYLDELRFQGVKPEFLQRRDKEASPSLGQLSQLQQKPCEEMVSCL
jgi:hypothetical protein